MIISIRGVMASGKSHLVRTIMRLYPEKTEAREVGRRKPVGYKLHGLASPLYVPGLYDDTEGGIASSTIVDMEEAYGLIWSAHEAGYDVLYEGGADGVMRLCSVFGADIAHLIYLDHPISECVISIRDRGKAIRVETVKKLDAKMRRDEETFAARGYDVKRLGRDAALTQVRSLLGV